MDDVDDVECGAAGRSEEDGGGSYKASSSLSSATGMYGGLGKSMNVEMMEIMMIENAAPQMISVRAM